MNLSTLDNEALKQKPESPQGSPSARIRAVSFIAV